MINVVGLASKAKRIFSSSLRRTTLVVFAVQVAGAILVFAAQVAAARVLGISEFGIYVYLLTWVTVISLFAKMGLDGAAIKAIRQCLAKNDRDGAAATSIYVLLAGAAVSAAAGGVFFVILVTLGARIAMESIFLAALLLPLVSVMQIAACVLRGYSRTVPSVFPGTALRPLLTLGGVTLIASAFPEWAHATGQFLVVIIATVCAVSLTGYWIFGEMRDAPVRLRSARVREVHAVGLSMLGVVAAAYLMRQTDILMLGYLVSTERAGIYSASVRIVDFIGYPLVAANMIVGPLIATRHAGNDVRSLGPSIRTATKVVLLVTCVLGGLVIIFGHSFLALFGAGFTAAYIALLILTAGQIVNAATGPAIELMLMTDNHGAAARVLWVFVALNLILNGILIPVAGMNGAAMATAISLAGWNVTLAIMAHSRIGVSPLGVSRKTT